MVRPHWVLLAVLPVVAAPVGAAVLWDQPLTGALGEALSQEMPDQPDGSTWAFDDFSIAAGKWTITHVTAYFYDGGGAKPNEGVFMAITKKASHNEIATTYPGTEVAPGMSATFVFNLPKVSLGPGKYWLAVWAKKPWGTGDDVRWRLTTPVRGSQYYFHNPGGGLGYGMGPVPGSTEFGSKADLAFRIEGTLTSPPRVTAHYPKGTMASPQSSITVTFDQAMNKSVTQKAFTIAPLVAGRFSWKGNQMIFDPKAPLTAGQSYRVQVSSKAKSAAGLTLTANVAWTFRVAPKKAPTLRATAVPTRGGLVDLAVSLSSPAAVQVMILNLAGREVAALPPRELPAGVNTLLWDGRSAHGTATPPGRYLVRVTARSADGGSASCLAPLQR